nr:pseudouridine synthase [Sphingomonas japonica]
MAKLLARAGIASRREIERMIAERRIAIDGVPLETPATVLSSLRGVTVDGEPVQAAAPARLFRFHKPTGLLTAERDPKGRPTIYDRIPRDLPRMMPVGRLDLNTEGLLLMTTDGELKRQLELPATGVERSYRARAYGEISQARLEDLIEGIEIEGVRYGAIDANLERRTGANVWIELTLTEGKNREVRRVLEHLGLKVSRLIRTRYGPFVLGDLPLGQVDEIRQNDLVTFRKSLEQPAAKRRDLRITETVAPRPAPVEPKPSAQPAPRMRGDRAAAFKARVAYDAAPAPTERKPPVRKRRPDERIETRRADLAPRDDQPRRKGKVGSAPAPSKRPPRTPAVPAQDTATKRPASPRKRPGPRPPRPGRTRK